MLARRRSLLKNYNRDVCKDADNSAVVFQRLCGGWIPLAVSTSREGDGDTRNLASHGSLIRPTIQQLQQIVVNHFQHLERVPLHLRHDAGDEPARRAYLDHGN